MAGKVIVVGTKRGNQAIPVSELKQMMGRAGRAHDGSVCYAHVIVEEERESKVRHDMDDESGMKVSSVIGNLDDVAFHLLPEICGGRVKDLPTAKAWFSRSLYEAQGKTCSMEQAFSYLEEVKAIVRNGPYVTATPLGATATSFYFHPADALGWMLNFTELFEMGLENDEVAPAWALGNVPVTRAAGDLGKHRQSIDECLGRMPPGLFVMDGCIVVTTLWWHCMGGEGVGPMKNVAMGLRRDSGRVLSFLRALDARVMKWDMDDWFDDLELRVKKGVPPELISLCKLDGISKNRADYLYNLGAREAEDLAEIVDSIDEDEVELLKAVRALI